MNSIALNNYNIWKNKLESISNKDFEALLKMDEEIISDSFYKDLSFGTGGLMPIPFIKQQEELVYI